MKNRFLLLCLLPLIAAGQESVQISPSFRPDTEYRLNMTNSTEYRMEYFGSVEFLSELTFRGVKNPLEVDRTTKSSIRQITGRVGEDGSFPILVVFDRSESSDGKVPLPDGTKMYGRIDSLKRSRYDSVVAEGLSEEVRQSFMKTMQSLLDQTKFPDEAVSMGGVLRDTSYFSIPVMDMVMDMTILTDYTLKKIKKGNARFDISQTIAMTAALDDMPMTAEGSGEGRMVYDIDKEFMLYYQEEMEMSLKAVAEAFSIELEQASKITKETEIFPKNE